MTPYPPSTAAVSEGSSPPHFTVTVSRGSPNPHFSPPWSRKRVSGPDFSPLRSRNRVSEPQFFTSVVAKGPRRSPDRHRRGLVGGSRKPNLHLGGLGGGLGSPVLTAAVSRGVRPHRASRKGIYLGTPSGLGRRWEGPHRPRARRSARPALLPPQLLDVGQHLFGVNRGVHVRIHLRDLAIRPDEEAHALVEPQLALYAKALAPLAVLLDEQ